jgi:hypothetical protein
LFTADPEKKMNIKDDHTPESLLPVLQSIVVPGNRAQLHFEHQIIPHLLRHLDNDLIFADVSCVSLLFNLLSQVLDHHDAAATEPLVTSAVVTHAVKHAVKGLQTFPDNRDVLANGAALIWIGAANHSAECLAEGALSALETASKVNHFANLEVGSRHPFRFKLGIIKHALSRLLEHAD